jgi:predicted ferric reductase
VLTFNSATATKTNWITLLTGVSHERLQVFHRWISYAFFILALLHTFPFIVYHIHWHDMQTHFSESLLFYWTGIVALIAQAWLTFMSHSTIRYVLKLESMCIVSDLPNRNLGYEFFKITHFACVIVFMITFFWHCDYTLTSWHYFVATAAVYVPCFVFPWLRTAFEYKWTQQAHIFIEDNGFTRVTIPANFHWASGQHCFLRFTGFGVLQAMSTHPFTVCSSPSSDPNVQSELVFYIRHQGGFTKKLYQHALDHPGVSVPVLVDGPYGGVNTSRLDTADHYLLIAGGSGAGWCLPFIEHFIHLSTASIDEEDAYSTQASKEGEFREHTGARRKSAKHISMRVILATRDTASRLWFERTVDALLKRSGISNTSSFLCVQVYLTGEAAEKADLSSRNVDTMNAQDSSTSQEEIVYPAKGMEIPVPGKEYEGRPNLPVIVIEEASRAAAGRESLAVYVCGPTTMQNDVRNAVAMENLDIVRGARLGGVYLHTEHFSWA